MWKWAFAALPSGLPASNLLAERQTRQLPQSRFCMVRHSRNGPKCTDPLPVVDKRRQPEQASSVRDHLATSFKIFLSPDRPASELKLLPL